MKVNPYKSMSTIIFSFSAFTDYIRPKDYLEPNAPKPINLCIDDFNAVNLKKCLLNVCVKIN